MKIYELTYIVSPEITSEEVEAKAKEIGSIIQSKEGTILKQSNPVAKTLSYPIEKRASGFFGVLEFQLEPEKLIEFEETLAKDGKIVRHMVTIKKAAELKKERRTRGVSRSKTAPIFDIEKKTEVATKEENPSFEPKEHPVSEGKGKVELKDIEQELDEILG